MDPFSLIAGVGGLISVTVQIAEILKAFTSDMHDTPEFAIEVASESSAMAIIFKQVQQFLQNAADSTAPNIDLSPFHETLELCEQTFSRLGALVRGLEDPDGVDITHTFSGRFRWTSEKIYISRLLRILNTQKGTLTLLLQLYMCNSDIEQRRPMPETPAAPVPDQESSGSAAPGGMARLQMATQHAYDEVLRESRVYRHVKRQTSFDSRITEATRETGWSRVPESLGSDQFSTFAFASMPWTDTSVHQVVLRCRRTCGGIELDLREGQFVRILYE